MNKSIAVILAKKESTRLPGKNFLKFNDKPIIDHSIKQIIDSDLFGSLIVSTDNTSYTYSGKVDDIIITYYNRNKKNMKTNSSMYDALTEVLEIFGNGYYDYVCLVHACQPLLKAEYIVQAYEKLETNKYDTVIPACNIGGYIMHSTSDKIQLVDNKNYTTNTQGQKVQYYDNVGMFYWGKIDKLYKNKSVLCKNMGFIELNKMECQDIDDADDWEMALWKYERMNYVF